VEDPAQAGQHRRVGAGHGQELLRLVHQEQEPPAALDRPPDERGEHVGRGQALQVLHPDVGRTAEGLAVLDAAQQPVGQPPDVAAPLQVPVEGHERRLRALLDPVFQLLQQAGLAQPPRPHHPQRVALAVQDLAQQADPAEEVVGPDPTAGDEWVTHDAGR